MDVTDRHPAVQDIARFFEYDHLPLHLQWVSKACHDLADLMVTELDDSPSLSHGLRALLRAKDDFVRAALD